MAALVAGMAYEVIKIAGKHPRSRAVRFILAPGLVLQRLTTNEPDSDQLEVAAETMRHLLRSEGVTNEVAEETSKELIPPREG